MMGADKQVRQRAGVAQAARLDEGMLLDLRVAERARKREIQGARILL